MILLNNTGSNTFSVPKHYHDTGTRYVLTLRSEITNKKYSYEVYDTGSYTDFYVFTVSLTIPEGEYVYTLNYKEDGSMAYRGTGLLRIGEFIQNNTKYNNEIKYTQYEY